MELLQRSQNNDSIGALLGALTRAVVTGVGLLTLNPIIVGAGGTMMAASAAL